MHRALRASAAAILPLLVVAAAGGAAASETDNLTYRFLKLEDSAPKLNLVVNATFDRIVERANETLAAEHGGDASAASDTEAELAFTLAYRDMVLRGFEHRIIIPLFEKCVITNDCPGWPRFERISYLPEESTYGEARYNRALVAYLSSTFDLCGVRLGTDKLTHLFAHGFLTYNASRQMSARIVDEEDARAAALADERGLMGARSTGVVSPADAEATRAGFLLARDTFMGTHPVLARDAKSGLLVRQRPIDVCTYITSGMDEALNPPQFVAGQRKVKRLEAAIEKRLRENEAAKSMSEDEKAALAKTILSRPPDPRHGKVSIVYKAYLALKFIVTYITMAPDSRRAFLTLAKPKLKLRTRTPIELARVGAQREPTIGTLHVHPPGLRAPPPP